MITEWRLPTQLSIGGAGADWSNSNNLLDDNDNEALTVSLGAGTSKYIDLTGFGFNLPPSAIVLGVEVLIRGRRAGGASGTIYHEDCKVLLPNNTSVLPTKEWVNTSLTDAYWGSQTTVAEVSTLSDNPTSVKDFNSSDFGFRLLARGTVSRVAGVAYIKIRLHYTFGNETGWALPISVTQSGANTIVWSDLDNLLADDGFAAATCSGVSVSNTVDCTYRLPVPRNSKITGMLYQVKPHRVGGTTGNARYNETTITVGSTKGENKSPGTSNITSSTPPTFLFGTSVDDLWGITPDPSSGIYKAHFNFNGSSSTADREVNLYFVKIKVYYIPASTKSYLII